MKFRWTSICLSLLAGTVISVSANAAAVGGGTFNLTGTTIGTLGGVSFFYTSQGDNMGAVVQPTLGVFSDLVTGSMQTIMPLTTANGVTPGTPFNFQNWIQLTDGINLDATSIPIPNFPVCPTSGSVGVGFQCLVNAQSPVVLTQGGAGVGARLSVYGNAHYAGSTTYTPFTGLLTSPSTNFNTIADFETYFNAHGGLPAVSYSASFSTVPEPASIWLMGLAFAGFGLWRVKRVPR